MALIRLRIYYSIFIMGKLQQVEHFHYHLFICLFVCFVLFHLYPPVTRTVALYFGRIRTRLGVVHFRVFRLFL